MFFELYTEKKTAFFFAGLIIPVEHLVLLDTEEEALLSKPNTWLILHHLRLLISYWQRGSSFLNMPLFGNRMVVATANYKHIEEKKKEFFERESRLGRWVTERKARKEKLRELQVFWNDLIFIGLYQTYVNFSRNALGIKIRAVWILKIVAAEKWHWKNPRIRRS